MEAASELLAILRKQGRYAEFTDKKLKEYEKHFQKRLDAWRGSEIGVEYAESFQCGRWEL